MAKGFVIGGSGKTALTKNDVTTALGYTPPQKDTTYDIATATAAGLMSAEAFATLQSLAASNSSSFWQVEAYDINYIRLTNGIQICWLGDEDISAGKSTFIFPVPFVDTNYKVLPLSNKYDTVSSKTSTTAIFSSSGYPRTCIFIGRWK